MVKVGIIGYGFMGETHAKCYAQIEGVEVVAVADLRKERQEKVKETCKAKIYNDGEDLIKNEKLDLIDICLPTFLHTKYGLLAMEKSKYVMIEKPLALTKKEGQSLIKKAKETGAQVQVGLCLRFNDQYEKMKEIIKSKKYGEIVCADMHRISSRPLWGWKSWLLDSKCSGGAAQDMFIHDLDYALYLFGKPQKFNTVKNIKGEKNCYIVTELQYKDFPLTIKGTWNMPQSYGFNDSFVIHFEKAVVEYNMGEIKCYTDEKTEDLTVKQKDLGTVEGGNVSELGEYYNELKYLTDLIKKDKIVDRARLVDGYNTLEYLLKVIK